MSLRADPPVDVIARVRLGDENAPHRVDCEAIEKRAKGAHDFDELIGCRVEDVQITIRYARMLDDVHDRADREDVVVVQHVFLRIEDRQVAIERTETS